MTDKKTDAKKVVKAGGDKGARIVEAMKANPSATRKEIAHKADATVGRVGEVVRWLAEHGTADEKRIVKPFLAAPREPKPKTTAKKTPAPKKTAPATKKTEPARRSRKTTSKAVA